MEKSVEVNCEDLTDILGVNNKTPLPDDIEEETYSRNEMPSEQFGKQYIVDDLEEYKKKSHVSFEKEGIMNIDELIIVTEENLLQIPSSIESLVDDLNKC